ncbi:MAG: TonB-dependent siderophore receptor [Acidobacteriota bacterium]
MAIPVPSRSTNILCIVPLYCLLSWSAAVAQVVDSETPATDAASDASIATEPSESSDPSLDTTETFAGSVTVVAPEPGYVAEQGSSAGKSAMPLLETPRSVSVVTRTRLDDLQSTGLQDALNYSAGVRSDAYGLDSRTDAFFVRGANPDQYLDGMRQHFNFYTSTTRTDPFLLERVEVLRGPSSMLYGQGTTAGLVNLISKRPQSVARHAVDLQLGSFERRQARADLTGPLDDRGRWLYRVVAVAREAETQVDHVPDDRALLAPSLTWSPNADTSLTLQLSWQSDRSGSTTQFFPWQGTVLPNPNGQIPVETFIGDPENDRYDSERLTFGWLLEHQIDDRWTLRHNLRWADNEVDYRALYADSFIRPGNSFLDPAQRILGRFAFHSKTDVRMVTADQHLEGTFQSGKTEHHVLIGVDALRFRETGASIVDFPDYIGGGVPSIDVYAPVHAPYTAPDLARDPRSTQEQVGLYLQDQIKLGPHWIVLAGLRHDWTTDSLEGAADEDTEATTGRIGLLYAAANGVSPYVSYSESFTPVAGTNIENQRFSPLRGEQVEVGIKVQPPGRALYLTAALYELKESNRLISDPSNPLNQIQAGDTESSGFEVEVSGRVSESIELTAHYNYLDQDAQLDRLPEHQAGLWGRHDFAIGALGRLSVGVGARYFSGFGVDGAPAVPELVLFDARIGWQLEGWHVALNVQNLEDETYVTTCLPRGDCFYGGRRLALLTAGSRF